MRASSINRRQIDDDVSRADAKKSRAVGPAMREAAVGGFGLMPA
jgi:hypothetical protein